MSRIRIKNVGPVKKGQLENNGWISIKKVTVFIGNQGSGKSTAAKLISIFTWMEKALTRGDYTEEQLKDYGRFKYDLLGYHRLESYLRPESSIEYEGSSYYITCKNEKLEIVEAIAKDSSKYHLPQIMYVPAERNFIANVKTPKALQLTSDSLITFVSEYSLACDKIDKPLSLPINNVQVEYKKASDMIYIQGADYEIKLTEASSGFQSLVPLYLVSRFLSNSILENKGDSMTLEQRERYRKEIQEINSDLHSSDEQKKIMKSEAAKRFNKTAFINIVEEPEQNLFPGSQWQMLQSLLKLNNSKDSNKLIITTHSPYIVSYLSVAIQAGSLKAKLEKNCSLLNRLSEVVDIDATISKSESIIYQLNENDGTISMLADFEGIPTDDNFLNSSLREGNRKFDTLLEIEEEL